MLRFTFKDLKFKLRRGKVPAVVAVAFTSSKITTTVPFQSTGQDDFPSIGHQEIGLKESLWDLPKSPPEDKHSQPINPGEAGPTHPCTESLIFRKSTGFDVIIKASSKKIIFFIVQRKRKGHLELTLNVKDSDLIDSMQGKKKKKWNEAHRQLSTSETQRHGLF